MFKREPEVKMLRFRCEHCGSRLVTPERYVDWMVTCDACGQTAHPAANALGTLSESTTGTRTTPVVIAPHAAAPEIHPALQLCAAPLAPLLIIGAVLASFVVGMRMTGALGRVVCVGLLVALAVAARHWLKAALLGIVDRLDQVEAVRLHHGSLKVVTNLLAWFWWQPRGRKPLAGVLIVAWGVLYTPYLLSATLFFWPRTRPLGIRV